METFESWRVNVIEEDRKKARCKTQKQKTSLYDAFYRHFVFGTAIRGNSLALELPHERL